MTSFCLGPFNNYIALLFMDGVERLLRSVTKKRGGWVEFYSLQELNNALANSNFAPVFK